MSTSLGKLPRWTWALVGLGVVGLAVYGLRETLTPIFFAFLIAYLLDPVVDRFEARGLPRALGIVIVLAITLGLVALVALLIVPSVVREVIAFGHELPTKLDGLRRAIEPRLVELGVEVPHSFEELWRLVAPEPSAGGERPSADIASSAASVLAAVGQWIWGGTSSVIGVVGTTLVVPVFAFYLLDDFDRMTAGIRDLVPWRYRPFVVDVAREVDQVLGQFVRGQLLVMLILAVLYAVAYSIVGIRLAIPIGIIAGLLSFIPYVGGASALILALVMCALGWQGWWQVAGVVIAYGVIQVLEGFVITPRIVGDKVGLPAVWVLVALMLAGEVFGFLGVLLAVPLAAIAKIFVVRALAYYKKTDLYQDGAPPDPPHTLAAGVLEEEGLPDSPEMAASKEAALGHTHAVDDEPAPTVSHVAEDTDAEDTDAHTEGLHAEGTHTQADEPTRTRPDDDAPSEPERETP